jgi:hypothetical protein
VKGLEQRNERAPLKRRTRKTHKDTDNFFVTVGDEPINTKSD